MGKDEERGARHKCTASDQSDRKARRPRFYEPARLNLIPSCLLYKSAAGSPPSARFIPTYVGERGGGKGRGYTLPYEFTNVDVAVEKCFQFHSNRLWNGREPSYRGPVTWRTYRKAELLANFWLDEVQCRNVTDAIPATPLCALPPPAIVFLSIFRSRINKINGDACPLIFATRLFWYYAR